MNRQSPVVRFPLALMVLAVSLTVQSFGSAQAVPFYHPDGTTHWYQVVAAPTGISWNAANVAALQARAHLATVTSQAESDFVFALVDSPTYWSSSASGSAVGPWLGGIQPPTSPEPGGNWKWNTAEPFTFLNWSATEPDNNTGNEDRVHFSSSPGTRSPMWADAAATSNAPRAYVLEWDWSPSQTVGVFRNNALSDGGYTIVSAIDGVPPFGATTTDPVVMIDENGRVVHSWPSDYERGFAPYLLDNGDLLRLVNIDAPGWELGVGGRVEQYSWNGDLVWEFDYASATAITHHDIERLPNGNVLMIVWELKTAAEAIAAGRDPALLAAGILFPDKIIEVQPIYPSGGTIVWEWSIWDHLIQDFDPTKANYGVVANHPELLDINYPPITVPGADGADWLHANAIDYNPALDQIVLSARDVNELWIIDHSTTTAEAAGHTGGNSGRGGDLLYRWGNPAAYRAGTVADQTVFLSHDIQWIDPGLPGAGNILFFNNGANRPFGFATVDEIVPPIDANGNYVMGPSGVFGPAAPTWSYSAVNPTDLRSPFLSGAQRLPNGNTLYCAGITGVVEEVTPDGQSAWRWVNPLTPLGLLEQGEGFGLSTNQMFRAYRHPATHPAFVGRNLSPKDPLEAYPIEVRARFGSVNEDNDSRADVLLINGSHGDVFREFYFSGNDNVSISLGTAPSGPSSANYALYLEPYVPTAFDVEAAPFAIGLSCIDLPIATAALPTPPNNALVNTIGFEALLGTPFAPGTSPAPVQFFQGVIPVGTYTIQGYILDQGSESGLNLSVTNALVIHAN